MVNIYYLNDKIPNTSHILNLLKLLKAS